MSLDLLLQSIASSSESIIRNAKAYDFALQPVPSLLPGPNVSKLNNQFLILMACQQVSWKDTAASAALSHLNPHHSTLIGIDASFSSLHQSFRIVQLSKRSSSMCPLSRQ
jgi:hypothetical protein